MVLCGGNMLCWDAEVSVGEEDEGLAGAEAWAAPHHQPCALCFHAHIVHTAMAFSCLGVTDLYWSAATMANEACMRQRGVPPLPKVPAPRATTVSNLGRPSAAPTFSTNLEPTFSRPRARNCLYFVE